MNVECPSQWTSGVKRYHEMLMF